MQLEQQRNTVEGGSNMSYILPPKRVKRSPKNSKRHVSNVRKTKAPEAGLGPLNTVGYTGRVVNGHKSAAP